MDAAEIRAIALDSSKKYYKFLEDNNKGIQEVDVFQVEYIDSADLILKLRLSAKLFDQESIFFKLLTNKQSYDNNQVKIIEYDSDKNILLIKPNDTVKKDFEHIRSSDIKVISDLKFLVKRVEEWYTTNGAFISLPNSISCLNSKVNEIKFLNDFQPSQNQVDSLTNIFTNPFTYVWGAPGTGKTQFVLAYAILHYIKNNKRVAIFAPTNNSLEQVLRGILKMTDVAGIDRKQIIRLGIPSRNFAEDFPEVCEEKGVQKKLDELDNQIKILNKVLNYNSSNSIIESANNLMKSFADFPTLESKSQSIEIEFNNVTLNRSKKIGHIEDLENEIKISQQRRNQVQKSIDSITHKIKKALSSSITKQEKELNIIDMNIYDIHKSVKKEKQDLKQVQQDYDSISLTKNKIDDEIYNTTINLIKGYNNISGFNNICSNLSITNWQLIKDNISQKVASIKQQNDIEVDLLNEYRNYSQTELISRLKNYEAARNKLASQSTTERITNVNVIASTLDGYIGKFIKEKLRVDHLFLDEAGYANVIKTLTLFNHSLPITFLGDHKQLPPVCEINDKDIQRDSELNNIFIWSQSSIYIDTIFRKTRDEALLQYLNNQQQSPKKLVTSSLNATYRFGTNLVEILGHHVYDNTFTSCNSNGETQIYFIHATKSEEYKSRISSNEVNTISSLVRNIKNDGNEDFVILTPYKKQVKLLGKNLPEERNNLKILTVHGSQGREWHTVILSVVDTNDKWFVDSLTPISKGLNLINTAVSRAKNRLIIVCDTNYWFHQPGQLITDLINNSNKIIN